MAEDRQYSQQGVSWQWTDNMVSTGFDGRGQTIQSVGGGGVMAENRLNRQHGVSWQRTENTVSTGFHGRGQRTQSAQGFMAEDREHSQQRT